MKTAEQIKDFLVMNKEIVKAMTQRPGIKVPELMALNERAMTLQLIIDWLNCEALDEDF